MRMSKIRAVLGGLALTAALAGVVRAEVPSDNFVLTITPSGDRGVNIGSGTVALGGVLGSTQTSSAIPVDSTGTVGSIEYTIQATALTGGSGWSFSSDGTNDGLNECIVRALFTNRGDPAPADSEYTAVTSLLSTSVQNVGDTTNFEGTVPVADMDNMALDRQADLYIRAVLPVTSSDETAKQTTITITAGLAN